MIEENKVMNGMRVQIVSDDQELLQLAPAWNDLFARADAPLVTQSFEWIWCVRKHLLPNARLRCIFLWKEDRLVLVWPAVILRHHRFWSAEVPLATPGDYIDFLVEKSPESDMFARTAWQHLNQKTDLTVIGRVRVSSLLHQIITEQGQPSVERLPARYLSWERYPDWGAYYKNLPGRKSIAARQRKLLERGSLAFEVVGDCKRVQELSEWMFQHKKVWLAAKGGRSDWLGSKSYEKFLFSLPVELKRWRSVTAFALTIDGKVIAVQICLVGMSRLIRLHDAYDQEFRAFAPQNGLTVRVMEWACERQLAVDFCFGADPYKEDFLPENRPVDYYRIVNSAFGKLHETCMATKNGRVGAMLRHALHHIQG